MLELMAASRLAGVVLAAVPLLAAAQAQAPSRGELLYSTHCISCHTSQIHWRDKKAATDWESLRFQVRRWQGNTGQGWTDADIDDVARYLNDSVYRFAPGSPKSSGPDFDSRGPTPHFMS